MNEHVHINKTILGFNKMLKTFKSRPSPHNEGMHKA